MLLFGLITISRLLIEHASNVQHMTYIAAGCMHANARICIDRLAQLDFQRKDCRFQRLFIQVGTEMHS